LFVVWGRVREEGEGGVIQMVEGGARGGGMSGLCLWIGDVKMNWELNGMWLAMRVEKWRGGKVLVCIYIKVFDLKGATRATAEASLAA